MRIATLLFVYNRSYHTEQVLTSLKQNSVLPEKLFIFQDGQKFGCDSKEWNKVNALINAINWCDKEIHVSAVNKGLATSIISGINYVFEKYDAVIVLEDDCVPAVNFISFMNLCFEKYEKDENMEKIRQYLQKQEVAKTRDIAELLGLSVARTRAILSEMDDVEAHGTNRNRTYRLNR